MLFCIKNGILLKCEGIIKSYLKNPKDDQNTLFLKYMYIFLTTHTVLLANEILVAATFFFSQMATIANGRVSPENVCKMMQRVHNVKS